MTTAGPEVAAQTDLSRPARAAQRLFAATQWLFVFAIALVVVLGAELVRGDGEPFEGGWFNNVVRTLLFAMLLAYAALYAMMDYRRRYWLGAALASGIGLAAFVVWGVFGALVIDLTEGEDPLSPLIAVLAVAATLIVVLGPPAFWFLRQHLGAWRLLRARDPSGGRALWEAMEAAARASEALERGAPEPPPGVARPSPGGAPARRLSVRLLAGRALVGLSIAGIAVVVVAALAIMASPDAPDGAQADNETAEAILGAGLFVLPLFGLLLDAGRRLSQPSAARLLEDDNRAPVLLLRSFSDDAATISSRNALRRFLYLGLYGKVRLESAIADELARLGPFIAVGQPGERLPALGAARAYLDDADWQTQVIDWIGAARLIVMVGGTTPWVGWELSQVAAAGRLDRLLVLLPPTSDAAEAEARWAVLRERLDGPDASRWAGLPAAPPAEGAIAVYSARRGGVRVLTSARPRQADYELAVRLAVTEILG